MMTTISFACSIIVGTKQVPLGIIVCLVLMVQGITQLRDEGIGMMIYTTLFLLFQTRLTRLVFLFKAILGKQNIRQFWIKDMSDIRGSDLKSVTIEFNNADEAERAQKLFHRFEYRNGKDLYPINAYLEFEKPRRKSPSAYRYGQDRFDSYSRGRSRSPHYDTSKLDVSCRLLNFIMLGPFSFNKNWINYIQNIAQQQTKFQSLSIFSIPQLVYLNL